MFVLKIGLNKRNEDNNENCFFFILKSLQLNIKFYISTGVVISTKSVSSEFLAFCFARSTILTENFINLC